MRKFILLTIILISAFSYSQKGHDSHSEKEKFSYNDKGLEPRDLSVNIEGMNKDELFAKGKKWVKEKFGDSKKE